MDAFSPIRGKCMYWRQQANLDDAYDMSVKKEDKRVTCTCFVEGDMWSMKMKEIPSDCPNRRSCRYYIKSG
ncbi:MAG: hypothetical protein CVT66_01525 [Actinobacteria bacterium HGW-Actinobacteria-6]|nr:MAG: hypothetical protein CVT66_01525 [Actinobacteria bacterium HGW-Actinobacteria-6]